MQFNRRQPMGEDWRVNEEEEKEVIKIIAENLQKQKNKLTVPRKRWTWLDL